MEINPNMKSEVQHLGMNWIAQRGASTHYVTGHISRYQQEWLIVHVTVL